MFPALYLEKIAGGTAAAVRELSLDSIPEPGDDAVTVDVVCSTINYKDALAITGRSPVVRRFPMVAGIDLAGRLAEDAPGFRAGDEVVVNGWGVGETHWGGLAQKARMRPGWLMRKPSGLSLFETMAIGTAGYTAALALAAIERLGIAPDHGEVLVSGATGGVGSMAVMLLAAGGYRVVGSTGKLHERPYLESLGAVEVMDRALLSEPGKPLQRERWAAAIDSVGSHTLANICASTKSGGVVAACGLAQGLDFPATVAPFILRGMTLVGINSLLVPMPEREAAWAMLDHRLDRRLLHGLTRTISLAEAIPASSDVLAGTITGRLVVDVHA